MESNSPDIESISSVDDYLCDETDIESSDESYSEIDESLGTTILNEIIEGTYTCLVCISEIDPYSEIWSCKSCYRVYDLECIQAWAKKDIQKNGHISSWKCPACNIGYKNIPKRFMCWCGKVEDPALNILNPFSCGNPCNVEYADCVHKCSSICHPGKHPICAALGPNMPCHCGLSMQQRPCIITPYEDGWACDVPCDNTVCNLGHLCPQKSCHSGFCGKCHEEVIVKCYCGDKEEAIKCYERYPHECNIGDKAWIGNYQCDTKTKVFYDCNIHFEEVSCQPPVQQIPTCKFSPSLIKTCYCGKVEVAGSKRLKCTDKMVECDQVCGKKLSCGCTCKLKCHAGECVCYNILEEKCSCGNYSYLVPCKFLQDGYRPKCNHKCPILLNCRRHEHKVECCKYEQEAMYRERNRKKAIRKNTLGPSAYANEIMTIEPVHICTRICNRLKKCGMHYCEGLCHPGPCGICLESTNEDLICNCGKTVINAPVRCGTKLECHEQCVRQKSCGHSNEVHNCHADDVKCPRCTTLVEKKCNCGLKIISNVICSQSYVSCGTTCKDLKDCGHYCYRVCNPDCTQTNKHASASDCKFLCNKSRKTCPHLCKQGCHYSAEPNKKNCDSYKCKELISASCDCGNLKMKIECGASTTMVSNMLLNLDCDESCASNFREQALRQAFEIENKENISNIYPPKTIETYKRQIKWCSNIESTIRKLVSANNVASENYEADGSSFESRYLNFPPPMNEAQIEFIQSLAEIYNVYSECKESGSGRSVFLVAKYKSVLPEYNISNFIQKSMLFIPEDKCIDKSLLNALLIKDLFFGITEVEIGKSLKKITEELYEEEPKLEMIRTSECILYFEKFLKGMDDIKEKKLKAAVESVKKIVKEESLAFDCMLCSFTPPER